MTEYWVSQSKHWCDFCKCWMSDTPNSRAAHERGIGHQTAVKRKLREMRLKEAADKKEEENLKKSLQQIEKDAEKAYERDRKEQSAAGLEASSSAYGAWEKQEGSAYLYNAKLRYYFDRDTGCYYGGDPPTWTRTPEIPEEGKCKDASAQPSGAKPTAPPSTAVGNVKKKVIRAAKPHPQHGIGGYSLASTQGTFGGARGLGGASTSQSSGAGASTLGKHPRSEGKPVSDAEKAELEAREAARKRVQARTMASFGLT